MPFGSTILTSDVQFAKVYALIVVRLRESVTFASFVHPWNAYEPRLVTVSGSSIVGRTLHPWNALLPIVLKP